MIRNYTFWTKAFIATSILTAVIHSISLFVKPVATNDTEEQLLQLMATYKMDAGAGFNPSMRDLFTALSSCFSLVYLLGALVTWYLLRKKLNAEILKGIAGIQLIIYGISFVVMLVFTFLPPIVLTGLALIFVSLSYVSNRTAQ
ncbi:MAG TPA: hypothetical protein VFW11_17475 [Cyclobacteriaceae bacterium]|nr:hypothetical protein [Cyclobacteriaceae bacterium]